MPVVMLRRCAPWSLRPAIHPACTCSAWDVDRSPLCSSMVHCDCMHSPTRSAAPGWYGDDRRKCLLPHPWAHPGHQTCATGHCKPFRGVLPIRMMHWSCTGTVPLSFRNNQFQENLATRAHQYCARSYPINSNLTDGDALRRASRAPSWLQGVGCAQSVGRKAHTEHRPLPQHAGNLQHSAVALHDMLDDRQPQTRTPRFARATAVNPVETLGQPGNMLRRNAGPGIPHGKDATSIGENMPLHCDAPARRGVAHRIADQIGQRALQLLHAPGNLPHH